MPKDMFLFQQKKKNAKEWKESNKSSQEKWLGIINTSITFSGEYAANGVFMTA